jgi:hypothetical protein
MFKFLLLQTVIFLLCVLALGCAPTHKVMLDNRGGISHAGRRIALLANGSYTDTHYTDALGHDRTERGRYTLNAEKTHLVLSPERGEKQNLYRVDYGGQQYWVREGERDGITQSGEFWLRQVSLRVVR